MEALGAVPEGINTQKLQRSLKCTAAELAAAGNKLLMNVRARSCLPRGLPAASLLLAAHSTEWSSFGVELGRCFTN